MQKICIIIPCYNEAKRLKQENFEDFFKNSNYNVCFVNDGSKDETSAILENLRIRIGENCRVINLSKNVGKAEAVRQGIVSNINEHYDYIGFFDADLSTPLDEIDYFIKFSGGKLKHDIIMGCRFSRLGADIKRTPFRHYIGRGFASVVSLFLKLSVYDTQCGAKIFSRKVYSKVFSYGFKSKWIFDVEILIRAINAFGLNFVKQNTIEVPLNRWHELKGSKLKWYDFVKAPLELIKIGLHYR